MANDKEIEIKGKVDIDLSDTKEQVLDFTSQISNLDKEINKLQNTLAKQARQMEIWTNKEVKNKKGKVTKPLGEIPKKAKNNFENTKTNLFGVIQKRNELYAQQVISSGGNTPRTQSELRKYIEKEKIKTENAMNQSYSGGSSFSDKTEENKRIAKLGAVAKTNEYSKEIQNQIADLFDSVIEESKKQNEKTYQSYLKSYTQSRKKEEAELRELKPGGENGEYKPRQLSRIKLTPEQTQEVQQMARKDANNRSPILNANMGANYINKWFSSLNENVGVSEREKDLYNEVANVFGKYAPQVQKALKQYVLVLDSQEKLLLKKIKTGEKEAEAKKEELRQQNLEKRTVDDKVVSSQIKERVRKQQDRIKDDSKKEERTAELQTSITRDVLRDRAEGGLKYIPYRYNKDGTPLKASGYREGEIKNKSGGQITVRNLSTFVTDEGEVVPGTYVDSSNQTQSNKTVGIISEALKNPNKIGGLSKNLSNMSLYSLGEAYDKLMEIAKNPDNAQAKGAEELAQRIVESIVDAYENTIDEDLRKMLVEQLSKSKFSGIGEQREADQLALEGKNHINAYSKSGALFDAIRNFDGLNSTEEQKKAMLPKAIRIDRNKMGKNDQWGDMDSQLAQESNKAYEDESINSEEVSKLNKIIDELIIAVPTMRETLESLKFDQEDKEQGAKMKELALTNPESYKELVGYALSQVFEEGGKLNGINREDIEERLNSVNFKSLGDTGRDVIPYSSDAVEVNAQMVSLDAPVTFKNGDQGDSRINSVQGENTDSWLEEDNGDGTLASSISSTDNIDNGKTTKKINSIDAILKAAISLANKADKAGENPFDAVINFIDDIEKTINLVQDDLSDSDLNALRDFTENFRGLVEVAQTEALKPDNENFKTEEERNFAQIFKEKNGIKESFPQIFGKYVEKVSFGESKISKSGNNVMFEKLIQLIGDKNLVPDYYTKGSLSEREAGKQTTNEQNQQQIVEEGRKSIGILQSLSSTLRKSEASLDESDDSFLIIASAAQNIAKMLETQGIDAGELKQIGATTEKPMSALYNAIANALNYPEQLELSIKKRIAEMNAQAGSEIFNYSNEMERFKEKHPEEYARYEATKKARNAFNEAGGIKKIEESLPKALTQFTNSGIKGLENLEEAFNQIDFLITKTEEILNFQTGNIDVETTTTSGKQRFLEALYSRMDTSGMSENPDKATGLSFYERNRITGEDLTGTPLEGQMLSPSQYSQLKYQAGYTGTAYGGKDMNSRLQSAEKELEDLRKEYNKATDEEKRILEIRISQAEKDIEVLKQAGQKVEDNTTDAEKEKFKRKVPSIEEKTKIEQETARQNMLQEQERTAKSNQKNKEERAKMEALANSRKALDKIEDDKDNKKEPIKQEEIKENSSQELIQESSNVQDSISKEQQEIDNVNDSIKEHTEEMDKAVDSESQKIIISEKLAKQLDRESDALDEVENKKDNDLPFDLSGFPDESGTNSNNPYGRASDAYDFPDEEDAWNTNDFGYRYNGHTPDLSKMRMPGRNAFLDSNPEEVVQRFMGADASQSFDYDYIEDFNRVKQYTKELQNQVKAAGEVAKYLTKQQVIQERISKLEQENSSENQDQIDLLKTQLELNNRNLSLAKQQYESATTAKDETKVRSMIESGSLREEFARAAVDAETSAQISMREVIGNSSNKAQVTQEVFNENAQLKDTKNKIKEYESAYKKQLQYERDIARLRKNMEGQSGVQLKDSERQVEALQNQLTAISSITSGYDRQNGTLNGIKLSTEAIAQLNQFIDDAQMAQATALTQINTQYNKQQGLLASILGGFRNAFRNITDASLAYTIINKVKGVINDIITATKELDSALVDIQIATGQTREQTRKLLVEYADLADELGRTTQSVATASNDWLRAGYQGKEAAELTRASMMLSTLGMIDASDATTYLISTLKGWKIQADEVIDVVDKLTVTICGVCLATSIGHGFKCR